MRQLRSVAAPRHNIFATFAKPAECADYLPEEKFFCDRCLSWINSETPIESRATLIVCPSSILPQWKREIEKHVKNIQLEIYEGTKKIIFPNKLSNFDIVLTTYDVLRGDLYHVTDEKKKYSLRYEKKYKEIPTPLTRIKWWRVCLDECQMVEFSRKFPTLIGGIGNSARGGNGAAIADCE
jgi:SNF2 family DNA or RNA helicase